MVLDGAGRSRDDLDAITRVCWHNSEDTTNVGHTLAVIFRENMLCLLNGTHDVCRLKYSTVNVLELTCTRTH